MREQSSPTDARVVDVVAYLLGVSAAQLTAALCVRTITSGGANKQETFKKGVNAADAAFSRDTLAKALYSRLFDWLVSKINASIAKPNFTGVRIGILDIYGFEIFQSNGFEQLCINYVNERLQQVAWAGLRCAALRCQRSCLTLLSLPCLRL